MPPPALPEVPLPFHPPNDPVHLTNTAGREILARVEALDGDLLSITVEGQPYQIKMDTLTPGSQATCLEKRGDKCLQVLGVGVIQPRLPVLN